MELMQSTLRRFGRLGAQKDSAQKNSARGHRAQGHRDEADPCRLLRDNPVLLLSGPRTASSLDALLRSWNPGVWQDERGIWQVADQVSWHGPFHLDPIFAAEAELPGGWSTAYAARAPRQRVRIPDGREAPALRLRYPKDLPAGAEARAWSLVSGLARRLGGATRLPSCPPHIAAPEEAVFCVYGHEALPWQVLRSVLELAIPDLARNGALAANDYCLERNGQLEIKVQPFQDDQFLPYALRARAGDGWPHTIYRFTCVQQSSHAEMVKLVGRCLQAALLLSDVIGGVLLDAEGFPSPAPPMNRLTGQR
jgi:hypothetical protein